MKLFVVVLIATISISSALSSTGNPTDLRCPVGYGKVGNECREKVKRIRGCPTDLGSSEGDRCYVDNTYCGYIASATVEDRTVTECDSGYSYDKRSGYCLSASSIDHGVPVLQCTNGSVEKDGTCRKAAKRIEVCGEDGSNSPEGCFLRRSLRFRGCLRNYQLQTNSHDDAICVFVSTAETQFCPRNFTYDATLNMCLSNLSTDKTINCQKGKLTNGKCIEVERKSPRHYCPLRSGSDQTDSRLCFAGIVKGSRCLINRLSAVVLGCPAGFDEMDDMFCVRSATTTSTATTMSTAASSTLV